IYTPTTVTACWQRGWCQGGQLDMDTLAPVRREEKFAKEILGEPSSAVLSPEQMETRHKKKWIKADMASPLKALLKGPDTVMPGLIVFYIVPTDASGKAFLKGTDL
ncbi:hypothetical protein KIPB_013979, partial [Kipferlia bialata]